MLVDLGYADERIARAMLKVRREDFLPPSQKEYAIYDLPLPIGFSQTTSAPSVIAFMLGLLDVREGMKVLEVGVGCGWQTALLSELVGSRGKVIGVDIIKAFVVDVQEKLKNRPNVKVVYGDGRFGYSEEAPYDRIIVSAAADRVYPAWKEQLKEGGRLVFPLGSVSQKLILMVKEKDGLIKREVLDVKFVPLLSDRNL
ncbi:MAG: protein-L-isoaspartate O-methyltransferase [Candidatus Asgardarchaeia archaeon]